MLPFSGFSVVELGSRISSGFCGKLLSNFGAEVTLIEGPEGNPIRRYGLLEDDSANGHSGLFGYLHAGKQSVSIAQKDFESLKRLVRSADVLIFGASNDPFLEEYNLFKKLSLSHAELVAIHISPYGFSGPYKDFVGTELTANALSGITQRMGAPDKSPLTLPLAQAGFQAGYAGASAAGCALINQLRSSGGEIIEVSESEALATVHSGFAVTRYQRAGINDKRAGHRMENLPYPQTVLPCADGYVELNTPERVQWENLLKMIGSPDWSSDERFRSRGKNSRPPLADELDIRFKEWLKDYTKDEFYGLCRQYNVPSGPVRTVDEIFIDEQLISRNFFTSIHYASGKHYLVPGSGFVLSKTPANGDLLVPRQGEHTERLESLSSAQQPRSQPLLPETEIKTRNGPLSGLRILDMGWVWAGAIPGQILADMGAEVIKVESAKRVDYMRLGRPIVGTEPDVEQNPWFHAVNRNKKSITVNLKSKAGIKIIKRLVAKCDAVVENFKPGFLTKIGLDFDSLSRENPGLVMLSMSGVGQTGPFNGIPAYAPFLSGLSGLDSLVGYPGEDILGIQQPYADTNAGVTGAFGLITALLHRQRTGVGQHVDLAESEAAIAVIGEAFVNYSMRGVVEKPQGNDRVGFAPCGHYPTKGEDTWIAIAVESEAQWKSLCVVLGQPDLIDRPIFANAHVRWDNRRLLDEELSFLTKSLDNETLFKTLQDKRVAAMPLLGPKEILDNTHFRARDTFIDIVHPVLGKETIFGPMWRTTSNSTSNWTHAPLLGQHTSSVMEEILEMTNEEINNLISEDVLV